MKWFFALTIVLMTSLGNASDPSDAKWYPSSYDEARDKFRQSVEKLKIEGWMLEHKALPVPSKIDQDLEIDALHIFAKKNVKNVVVITSGIHGAEAFTGSALQIEFLKNSLTKEMVEHSAFVFIHPVNPYGFRHGRRVSENNIDLNRNFAWNQEIFETENLGYVKLFPFLNPKKKANHSIWVKMRMFFGVLAYLSRMGKGEFRQAAIGGQYTHNKGIYFGGRQPEPNVLLLKELFKKWLAPYDKIFHIDLHTGYGERGRLHLFGTNAINESSKKLFAKVFSGLEVNTGDQKDFYKVSGDFTQHTVEIFPNKTIIPMTFEYGTQDSQTILGGFFSLRSLIQENQGFHHGYVSEKAKASIKKDFRSLFNPTDTDWRQKALVDGISMLEVLLPRFWQD